MLESIRKPEDSTLFSSVGEKREQLPCSANLFRRFIQQIARNEVQQNLRAFKIIKAIDKHAVDRVVLAIHLLV